MWLVTQHGFYNVVHGEDDPPDVMTIKGRRREDMEAIQFFITTSDIDESFIHDYRFRVKAKRADVMHWLSRIGEEIDYPKTKPRLSKSTPGRDGTYLSVWSMLYDLQED